MGIRRRDLADVQPDVVEGYLRRSGWTRLDTPDENFNSWEREKDSVQVPQKPEFVDYGRRLHEAVGIIALVDGKHVADLTQELIQGAVLWRYIVKPGPWGWGIFLLDSTGMFAVVSDYGNYAFKWTDWGKRDFRLFLIGLDKSYLCGKLAMDRSREYQGQRTLENIRDQIIQLRRDGSLTKEQARKEWELAKMVDSHYAEDFAEWLRETKLGSDSYELSVYDTPAQIRLFYDRVFTRLVEVIKEDLNHGHASD